MNLTTTYDGLHLCSNTECWNDADWPECKLCGSSYCEKCNDSDKGLTDVEEEAGDIDVCPGCMHNYED